MDSTDTSGLNSDYGWQEKQHEHLKLYLLNKFYQLKPLPVVCHIWIASPSKTLQFSTMDERERTDKQAFFYISVQITSRYKQWAQSTSPILFQSKSCCSISNTLGLWVIMLLSSFWTRLFRHPTVNRGRFNIKYLYSPCWPFRLFWVDVCFWLTK